LLGPLLRIYEGCGRAYLGEVEVANLITIHRRSGKLSYLVYPEFDSDPHPALLRCVKLSLRTRQLECYDYPQSAKPPILHRKESFLCPDDPRHARFARLTAQEEKHGLLEDASAIGTKEAWGRRVRERGICLKGHRLVRCQGDLLKSDRPVSRLYDTFGTCRAGKAGSVGSLSCPGEAKKGMPKDAKTRATP